MFSESTVTTYVSKYKLSPQEKQNNIKQTSNAVSVNFNFFKLSFISALISIVIRVIQMKPKIFGFVYVCH